MMRLFVFMILFGVTNVTSNDEVTLTWQATKKLSWDDFRGPIDNATDAVAVTASGITFSFSVKQRNNQFVDFETKVFAHFYPEKSWYNKARGNAHILAHEQLHFDITELHARQLRYKISKLNVSQSIKDDLRRLHLEANKNLAQMQKAYDAQSENSINFEQQFVWNNFVDKALKKYEAYSSK